MAEFTAALIALQMKNSRLLSQGSVHLERETEATNNPRPFRIQPPRRLKKAFVGQSDGATVMWTDALFVISTVLPRCHDPSDSSEAEMDDAKPIEKEINVQWGKQYLRFCGFG